MDDFGDDDIDALVNDEDELRAEMVAENENQVELEPEDESDGDDVLGLSEKLVKKSPDRQKNELGVKSYCVTSYKEKQTTAAAPRPFSTSSVVNELERKALKSADKRDILSRLQQNRRAPSHSGGFSSHMGGGGMQWMETIKDVAVSRIRDPKRVLNRPPFGCESVYWTVPPYQTRVYFRLMRAVGEETIDEFVAEREATDKGLLSASNLKYDAVFREVEQRIADTFIKSSDADVNDELKRIESNVSCSTSAEGCQLWVNSHAPSAFTHLLSDERINREVLRAVKTWDPFVFGKDYRKKKSPFNNTAVVGSVGGQLFPRDRNLQFTRKRKERQDLRPTERIILLCGPPGLGKTTLAHIVARQAGYNPVEINASDDRTATVLKQRIVGAMESNNIFGGGRPNCIILDEVDGADSFSTVQMIVSMCAAPLKHGKTKKTSNPPLTRPLILICNNQYAPQLRVVRTLASAFVFRKTSPQRLVNRLRVICALEGISASSASLSKLSDKTKTDIRASINCLQLVAKRDHSVTKNGARTGAPIDVTHELLKELLVGGKDFKSDAFQVYESVFFRPRAKGGEGLLTPSAMAARVWEQTESLGDHRRTMEGIHQNLFPAKYTDPNSNRTAASLEWLSFADMMDHQTHVHQDYSFQCYIPAMAVGVHIQCCSDTRMKLNPPTEHMRFSALRDQRSGILRSFSDGRRLSRACGMVDDEQGAQKVITPLLSILTPPLRPVNPEILAPSEKKVFSALVRAMASCGLTYRSVITYKLPANSADADNSSLELEPPIHQLTMYGQQASSCYSALPESLKKAVAQHVAAEKISRIAGSDEHDESILCKDKRRKVGNDSEYDTRDEEVGQRTGNRMNGVKRKVNIPFWRKRPRCSPTIGKDINDSGCNDTVVKHEKRPFGKGDSIRYVFNGGFTSGIKKPVRIEELV